MRRRWRAVRLFFGEGIWHRPDPKHPVRGDRALGLLRIVVLAGRGFGADALQMRASALTYYSLLSMVPMVALAFGIAKGFGLEAGLEARLNRALAGHEEVLVRVLEFARSLLADTRGGLVAGAGIALLLWSVIRLLTNIEISFNAIWGVDKSRSQVRRLTDYFALIVAAPLLLLGGSAAAVFISGSIDAALEVAGVLEPIGQAVRRLLELTPFLTAWALLTLLYMAMPNTRVSWRAGIVAGVVAGTLYQGLQFGYLHFQFGVARHNAIYGSFAALPLFLVWLHASWLIVLIGAEISFAVDNVGDYARERTATAASHHQRRLLALGTAAVCADRFVGGQTPATPQELADRLDAPVRLVQSVLSTLTDAGILSEVRDDERRVSYQPAHDPARTRLCDVADAFDRRVGRLEVRADAAGGAWKSESLEGIAELWTGLANRSADSDLNLSLPQIAGRIPERPDSAEAGS